jgi:hypothetical protein
MISEPSVAHFLMQEADRVALGIVGAEAVRADELGKAGRSGARGSCRLRRHAFPTGALRMPALRELPRGFRPGEAAADDMDLMGSHKNFA